MWNKSVNLRLHFILSMAQPGLCIMYMEKWILLWSHHHWPVVKIATDLNSSCGQDCHRTKQPSGRVSKYAEQYQVSKYVDQYHTITKAGKTSLSRDIKLIGRCKLSYQHKYVVQYHRNTKDGDIKIGRCKSYHQGWGGWTQVSPLSAPTCTVFIYTC